MEIYANGVAEAYGILRNKIINAPICSPRGLKIKEILGASIHIRNPQSRLAYHEKRKFNLAFAITELTAMVHGVDNVDYISAFNKNVRQFSDDGKTFYGAYGPRIKDALHDVILRKLTIDRDTRQAVITIYSTKDGLHITKDVPCTLALHFIIRDKKLHLFTYMRSNDLFWGLVYDIFCFSNIQEMIANELEIDLGEYHHYATSLHVYEHHFSMLEEIAEQEEIIVPNQYDLKSLLPCHEILLTLQHDRNSQMKTWMIYNILENVKDEKNIEYASFLYAKWRKNTNSTGKVLPVVPMLGKFL